MCNICKKRYVFLEQVMRLTFENMPAGAYTYYKFTDARKFKIWFWGGDHGSGK